MSKAFLNLVKYNNAFTVIVIVCFLSFGVTFAASAKAREVVYSAEEILVSSDNSEIISADLEDFDFRVQVGEVTEDENKYYVEYTYDTLAVENGEWKPVEVQKTLSVRKTALEGKDLGLYVAKELGENMDYELSYLGKVQKLEKERGESEKVVVTEYSGLVGKLLNTKDKIFEGYRPVVVPVKEKLKLDIPYVPPIPPEEPIKEEEEEEEVDPDQTPKVDPPTPTGTTTPVTIDVDVIEEKIEEAEILPETVEPEDTLPEPEPEPDGDDTGTPPPSPATE